MPNGKHERQLSATFTATFTAVPKQIHLKAQNRVIMAGGKIVAPPMTSSDGQSDGQGSGELSALRDQVEALERRIELSDARMYQVVARLAHELRSPLGAILMWAHVLRGGQQADHDVAADAIEQSARCQSKMIGSLLDVCRALAGQLRIERSQVDLSEIVRGAIDGMAPLAVAREVILKIGVAEQPVRVRGDRARLGEMIASLLDNAIKFTPPHGEVHLHLTRRLGEKTDYAIVLVRDTGKGVARADLQDLFKPFRPPGEFDGRTAKGLGIGLALVKLLAELHGGTVFADSEGPGRGSTFSLQLPIATDAAP